MSEKETMRLRVKTKESAVEGFYYHLNNYKKDYNNPEEMVKNLNFNFFLVLLILGEESYFTISDTTGNIFSYKINTG